MEGKRDSNKNLINILFYNKYMKKYKFLLLIGLALLIILVVSQINRTKYPEVINEISTEFSNEQKVEIIGYDGDAMEPHISRDEKYLFFNTHQPKDLFYAQRIDYTTFEFKGEILGINTPAVEGTPSLVNGSRLYFVSTRDFERGTIYSGIFLDGAVEELIRIPGSINVNKSGWLNMDVWVSPDGKHMYTSHANFKHGTPPSDSDIRYAIKEGDEFNIPDNKMEILKNINTEYALEYAPELSDNGLELFYSQLTFTKPNLDKLYHAKRKSIDKPFGKPKLIMEAYITDKNSFFEAPTITSDGKRLYYHKMDDGKFSIFMLTRN
jgi:hypothetical protein